MRPWIRAFAAGAFVAAAAFPFAPSARAESHKDERLGYSFSYPQRWAVVPVDSGGHLAAKFQSNREYEYNDAKTNFWVWHKPYIEVIVIPFSAKDNKGVTVEKTDDGVKVTQAAPWKDVKEYMEKVFQERGVGGFHFSAEDETTIDGMKVRRFEITVDKILQYGQKEMRIYGWEFTASDCYYGLVSEVLLKEEKKLKPEILQSFSTFRVFPRTGKLPGTATPGSEITIKDPTKEANKEQTPEEAKKERDEETARHLNRLKEGMGKDWVVKEGKNFIAVSHAGPKYTQEVMSHAEALRNWLETNLGFVGSGYTGKIILRIFEDRQEYNAFQTARRSWSWNSPEVTTFRDKDGWDSNWNSGDLNTGIYRIWLRDKNDRLAYSMPAWLSVGLYTFIRNARLKSGKIDFKADTWESVEMKNLRRADNLMHVRDFFSTPSAGLNAREGFYNQNQFFLTFLLDGGAQRSSKYKNVLSDYIKNLIFLLDSEDTTPQAGADKPPTTEEEENAMIRRQQEAWTNRESEHLTKLLEKTFPGWTDKEWDAFNAAYRQDLK